MCHLPDQRIVAVDMKPLPLALLATAATLAPASAAVAAPHWSSPVEAIPITADATPHTVAPMAFVAPGGQTLALSGDGARALLAAGDVKGVFGAPVPIGSSADGRLGARGAVGPQGQLAVAWATDRGAHVTVVPAGGQPGPTTDLPGNGVNTLGVAIAADGSVIVAYRTKDVPNRYALQVAIAPAGGAFGAPVAVDEGGPIDNIEVTAGPGGALAIAYRKYTGGNYRAHVVVRAPGAATFGAPERVSEGGDDFQPQVAFDSDGTVVAAWGSMAGGRYALRVPGAAFGPARPLGDGPTTSVDLAGTPSGGVAAALAGSGRVQAAGQAPGGEFGPAAQVGSYSTSISPTAAVTAAADGTVTVVYANPADGAVHAVDVGGGDTVIGYGAKGTVTAVSAASGADRSVALWTAESGSVMAATRSEQAPPSTGPGTAPAGPDRVAPKVRLVSSKRIRVTKKTKSIALKVRCNEACSLQVTGDMRTKAGRKKVVSPFLPVKTKAAKSGTQTVRMKLDKRARRALGRALQARRGALVYLRIEATDAAHNSRTAKVQLSLKAKAKHKRR